jgi:hypothetical protein
MTEKTVKKPFKQPIVLFGGESKDLKVKSTVVVGDDVFESSEPLVEVKESLKVERKKIE